MSAKKGLGRGFDSLIPTEIFAQEFDSTKEIDRAVSEYRHIALTNIVPDASQPRRHFDQDALEQLTASIRLHGVVQPIVVTELQNHTYQIIAGERRFRAARAAGLEKIPTIVRTVSAQEKVELAIVENVNRHDLNPIETAMAYAKLRDQFNMTIQKIGELVGGKSGASISNTLRLLKLPKEAQLAVADGLVTEGQIRPLIGTSQEVIDRILPCILEQGWSARRVEKEIQVVKSSPAAPPPVRPVQKKYKEFEAVLNKKVALPTKLIPLAKGGKIEVRFKSDKELEELLKKIQG